MRDSEKGGKILTRMHANGGKSRGTRRPLPVRHGVRGLADQCACGLGRVNGWETTGQGLVDDTTNLYMRERVRRVSL